jgi:hypothetical protein
MVRLRSCVDERGRLSKSRLRIGRFRRSRLRMGRCRSWVVEDGKVQELGG